MNQRFYKQNATHDIADYPNYTIYANPALIRAEGWDEIAMQQRGGYTDRGTIGVTTNYGCFLFAVFTTAYAFATAAGESWRLH